MSITRRKPRILFVAGPGDIVSTFRHWKAKKDDPSQLHITFSSQFYDLCKENGIEGYAVSSYNRVDADGDDQIRVVNRPHLLARPRGMMFHLEQFLYSLRMIWECRRQQATIAIVCNGTHLLPYSLLRLFGIELVPTLGCVLWRVDGKMTAVQKLIHWLDGIVLSRFTTAILSTSSDISDQIEELTKGAHAPIVEFTSSFRRELFATVPPIPPVVDRHHIFFGGRIEPVKGVFDMLEMARRLRDRGRSDIVFHLCGDGSALEQLRREVADSKLSDTFHCYGHCDHIEMTRILGQSHFAIVPSRSAMIEGLNQVVVESILAGRPVITSRVCPAVRYVNGAACVVPPDDLEAYCRAILRMCDDEEYFQSQLQACANAGDFFYDPQNSWKRAAMTVVEALQSNDQPPEKRLPFARFVETDFDATKTESFGLGAGI
jgi:glycogen(starch) synthase